jgi:Zn-finger nucleic acid-binding protein
VAAVQAYTKINAAGQWIDRSELNELFERTSVEELDTYAKDAVLPNWFKTSVAAICIDGREGRNER